MWVELLRYVPLSFLSWCVGRLANLRLPQPLASWTIRIFARAYGIDPLLATRPLEEFHSIGEFFTRDLEPRHRPTMGSCVFPVDGTLRHVCDIEGKDPLPQVKGRTYSLSQLLAHDPLVSRFSSGQVWNMYLSPKDGHHIYAPLAGRIIKTVYVPGALWPVNDWALRTVDGLFATNERIISFLETEQGLIAVVMVGATNVGAISLAYCDLETNKTPWKQAQSAVYQHATPREVSCGEKIGTFKMGSSVVMIAERPLVEQRALSAFPRSICYGQALA
jgi:phosphatidylserine decarboxylase